MRPHPAITALRSDDAPQRQAQAALFAAVDAWRASIPNLLTDIERFGSGADIGDCQSLAALFSGEAARLSGHFAARIVQALGEAPLAQVPLRHFTDGVISTLLLARSGRASLSLSAVDGAELSRQPPPRSASFAASESREVILAGRGRADLVVGDRRKIALFPGVVIVRDCAREALVLRDVRGLLVSLRLQRRKAEPVPTREIDLATGETVHQAAATAEDSRRELMIALLGRMSRRDAAPILAEIACESGPQAVRWQALRECLGLDTLAGFQALTAIARAAGDPLQAPAHALRRQLVESHPELALCPA